MNAAFEAVILGSFLVFLFILGGFFSGIETALISLSRSKTTLFIKEYPRKGKYLTLWLKEPNEILSTLLIGINAVAVSSATLSAIMADELARHFDLNKALLTTLSGFTVTFIIILFGEIVPKIFAIHNAEKTVRYAIAPLYYFHKIINPLTRLFTKIGVHVIRLFGGKAEENTPIITREEIRSMVRLGSEEGILKGEEGSMLRNIFRFSEKVAKDAMLPIENTYCVNAAESINHILKGTVEEGHTRMPVYKGERNNIIGIVHGKDLINLLLNKKLFVLADLMRPPYFINENSRISDLLTEFKMGKVHMAIVKNSEGLVTGVVTLEDVLEEIVGDINNEFEQKTSQ